MRLDDHWAITEAALAQCPGCDDFIASQVSIGSWANDLCEFTNEGEVSIPKHQLFAMMSVKEKLLGGWAVYQSHFGKLTALHAMSKEAGESAGVTQDEMKMWFEFLSGVYFGTCSFQPDQIVGLSNVPIQPMFSNLDITFDCLFDSQDPAQIKYRALGMMLHLIQDSYTPSHCGREGKKIRQFYNYGCQNKSKHKKADKIEQPLFDALVKTCGACLKTMIDGKTPYNWAGLIDLSKTTQASGGGPY